ncbi:OmpA family protein [Roseomonas sp. PWR1]|uniref:OmpA family protein n=1 Tax=Roseomonas nitratireducens TaxID=2820810 RepID=A0ABS4AW21_9PROT|nr:OmpA family protein [Neoroseomonas nitratireducens]MBP0465559.1 OmpA family protein [Neoroseomonas nitratireducens]
MRAPLLALLAGLSALPAAAQAPAAPDPMADSIVRNLTRGIRIPGREADAVTAPITPSGPVQAATTAPPEIPAVSLMVTFATGSATLTPQADAVVAALARALAAPELARSRIRIEGHTDTVGDGAMNLRLSERRAEAVRTSLITRHGIAPGRLETLGLGETQLLVATSDNVPETRNRRVQILNIGE